MKRGEHDMLSECMNSERGAEQNEEKRRRVEGLWRASQVETNSNGRKTAVVFLCFLATTTRGFDEDDTL